MKARITHTNKDEVEYREFQTLEELLVFVQDCGYAVILSAPIVGDEWFVEIYDDYRE